MNHVEGSCLNASNADRPISFQVFFTIPALLQHKVLVPDLGISPVVFGVETNEWIISALLVVVDHPISIELRRLWIVEKRLDIRILAKILIQSISVYSVLSLQSPAARTADN